MTKIKICGLRRLEDALMVNEGRPDFAGFILTPSKRQITTGQAIALSRILDPSIARVGVFVQESPEEIAQAASKIELDGIQLHLDTTPSFLDELKNQLIRYHYDRMPFLWQRVPVPSSEEAAGRQKSGSSQSTAGGQKSGSVRETGAGTEFSRRLASFADLSLFDGLLLDTYHDGQDGGTGQVFPWKSGLAYLNQDGLMNSRIIVAGGLTIDNVADAISVFRPYAVDVSSGVETDGYKDHDKVLRFIETARKAQVH